MLVEDFEAGVEGASEEAIVPGGEAATSSCSLCLHQRFVYNQEKHLFVCFCKTKFKIISRYNMSAHEMF